MKKAIAVKKITRATLKSFLKKNDGKIYIELKSSFDGMTDCVMPCDCGIPGLLPAERDTEFSENRLGYKHIWLVGHSNDYFSPFENNIFYGIRVSNCCGSFNVLTPK
jgi:hypothetical protein